MLDVLLKTSVRHADDVMILSFEPDGAYSLPPVTAGSHICIDLPGGMRRSYSLIDPPGQTNVYTVAIRLTADSLGGSAYLSKRANVGDRFRITSLANNFTFFEDAPQSVFIAGGIGITPLWSMIQRLQQLTEGGKESKDWRLYYACRNGRSAAFLDELTALERARPGRVFVTFSDSGERLDIERVVSNSPLDSQMYCCGPTSMLDAFKSATKNLDSGTVHWEHFGGVGPSSDGTRFTVELRRTGRSFSIAPGDTILDTLIDAGIAVNYGCQQGNCGACETRVLEGIPAHRDLVLSDEEQASNATMMICCSGSASERLVLDL